MKKEIYSVTCAALLAAASLLALSCSPTAESVCKDTCDQYKECAANDFYDDYNSIADCRSDCIAILKERRSQDKRDCYEARLDYQDCTANLSCSELVSYYNGGGQCSQQESDFVRICNITY